MDLSTAKVCIPTSSGGHLTHMWLLKPVWLQAVDRFWVTFDKEDANTLLADCVPNVGVRKSLSWGLE